MLVIANALVHDGLGNSFPADIAVKDGKFHDIGAGCAQNFDPAKVQIVDAQGGVVLPGFVSAINTWGTAGPGWREGDNHESSDPVTPEMNIVYGFDHDGMNFQKVYEYGVTAAGIAPSAQNIISGRSAVFKTIGKSPYRMLIKEDAAMIASVTKGVKKTFEKRSVAPMTRMGIFSMLVSALEKAQRHTADSDFDAKSVALKPVLSGSLPLFVSCSGKAQIDAVFRALAPFPDVRLVLTGAFGLDRALLEAAPAPLHVILGDQTEAYFPDSVKTVPEDIVPLLEANDPCSDGTLVAISNCGDGMTSGKESLLWNAIYWRRRGLSAAKALTAITAAPAKLLGVSDRIGSIEIGKDADFSIWTQNPLETYHAQLRQIYIDGRDVRTLEGGVSCW